MSETGFTGRTQWGVIVHILIGALLLSLLVGWLQVGYSNSQPVPAATNAIDTAAPTTAAPTTQTTATAGASATPKVTSTATAKPKPAGYTLPKAKSGKPLYYEVAQLSYDKGRFNKPNGKRSKKNVKRHWYGWPSKLLIVDRKPGWLKVRLQQRPNGSTAWITTAGVTIYKTPYLITLQRKQRKLTLYKNGEKVFSAPIAIGKASTPTPKGSYFVTMLEPPSSPGYGPIALTLSAHSTAIKSFRGSGDAIIAIHGPVGTDAKIGSNGAAISNGCIRMHKKDLRRLKVVRPGSPVIIT